MRQPLPPPKPSSWPANKPPPVAVFVWVKTNGAYWPQVWFFPLVGIPEIEGTPAWEIAYWLDETLAGLLTDSQNGKRGLDTLAGLFPAPQGAQEARLVIPAELAPPEPDDPSHEPVEAPVGA